MFKSQNSITIQIISLVRVSCQCKGKGETKWWGLSCSIPSEEKWLRAAFHRSVPPPSARGFSCQDNCCQDMLVFLGNNFNVYSKPCPMSVVTPTREATRLLAPCGVWERVAREDKSSYQRGICRLYGLSDCTLILKTKIPKPRAGSLFKPWQQN